MRVLVTGGCGFIGANLAPMLRARGHEASTSLPVFRDIPHTKLLPDSRRALPQSVFSAC